MPSDPLSRPAISEHDLDMKRKACVMITIAEWGLKAVGGDPVRFFAPDNVERLVENIIKSLHEHDCWEEFKV